MKIRIAIVDDHEIIIEGLKVILNKFGDFKVVLTAQNGDEIFDKLAINNNVDIILLDMNMPGMSGIDLLIKLLNTYSEIKILVLTIHPFDKFAQRTFFAGAHGYLCKDTALEYLHIAIREVVKGNLYFPELLDHDYLDDWEN